MILANPKGQRQSSVNQLKLEEIHVAGAERGKLCGRVVTFGLIFRALLIG